MSKALCTIKRNVLDKDYNSRSGNAIARCGLQRRTLGWRLAFIKYAPAGSRWICCEGGAVKKQSKLPVPPTPGQTRDNALHFDYAKLNGQVTYLGEAHLGDTSNCRSTPRVAGRNKFPKART